MSPTVQSLRAVECYDYHARAGLVWENSSNPQRFPPQGFRPGKLHPLLKAKRRTRAETQLDLRPSLRAHAFCPPGSIGGYPLTYSCSASTGGTRLKCLLSPSQSSFLDNIYTY